MKNVRSFSLKLLCILAFALAAIVPARAQFSILNDQTTPPIPGVGHDYIQQFNETVNPGTGSLSLRLSVPLPPGRKLSVPFAFSYDSGGTFVPSVGGAEWTSATPSYLYAGGWSYSVPSLTINTLQFPVYGSNGKQTGTCNAYTGLVFSEPATGRNGLGVGSTNCPNLSSATAAGGEFFLSSLSTSPAVSVAGRDGTVYNFGWEECGGSNTVPGNPIAGGMALPSSIEDTNGNLITFTPLPSNCNGSFTAKDTLGRNVISSSGFGVSGNTVTVAGYSTPYSVTWENTNAHITLAANLLPGNTDNECGATTLLPFSGSIPVVQAITLPNGEAYTFSYDPTYGLVNKITYPSGGTVTYTWSVVTGYEFGLYPDHTGLANVCGYAIDALVVSKRVVSFDGSTSAEEQDFQYSQVVANGNWTGRTTTVTTKDLIAGTSFQTIYNYVPYTILPNGPWMTPYYAVDFSLLPLERTITYQNTNGATLETVTKGWYDPNSLACELHTLSNGLISGTFYAYQITSFNSIANGDQLVDKKEYDYGLSSTSVCPSSPLAYSPPSPTTTPTRETKTSYQSFAATPIFQAAPSILNHPSSISIYGNGTLAAQTSFSYDQNAVKSASATQHDETIYGPASTGTRGNVTTVIKQCIQSAPACTNGNPTTTYAYDETGQVLSMTDPCGHATCDGSGMVGSHTTSYAYADSYTPCSGAAPPAGNTNAYLTNITDPLGHTKKFCYGYTDGQLRSATDPNSQTTSYAYNDSLDRLTEADYPDGGQTLLTYNDAPPTPRIITQKKINSSGSFVTTFSNLDGMGHVTSNGIRDCQGGRLSCVTEMTYDGLGRVLSKTNPFVSVSDPTYGITTYAYDALDRLTLATNPDSSTVQTTYSGRATKVTDEGNGTKGVQRISQSDALGRLTSVCEVSTTTLSFGTSNKPIACGQDISATGFLTSYQYDALDNLLSVSQGSLNPRTFVYDSLSRLTSSTNPESGTTSYTYDANGNMTVRTSPAPNQTNPSVTATNGYNYDVLNRLYGMNSTNNNIEPNMFLYYDQPNHGDSIGRLTEKGVFSLPINNWFSNSTFTYDAMGRVTTLSECASQNCPPGYYWNATYGYDYLGDVTSWTDAFATTFSATYDANARLTSVTNNLSNANYPSPMFSAATYNAPGLLTSATIGSGTGALSENRTYNNRLRPTTLTDGTAYSFNISNYAPDGNILAVTDSVNGSWGYGTGASYTGGYDDLNRLLTAIPAGQTWSYSYTYDRYGNRWQQNLNGTGGSGHAFSTTFDANNRISDGSVTYDAAGNVMQDPFNSYTYDFHHRILSTLSLSTGVLTCYLYDIDGRRVQRVTAATACGYPPTGGTSLYYVYDSSGHVIDEVSVPTGSTGSASTGNWTREEVYAGGRHLATFTPGTSGQAYWDLADWLGTERARVNAVTGAVSETCTSLPWGDNLQCSSTDISPLHFTGKERDSESGLDNFGARYNSSNFGRFMSPDPSGLDLADLTDPQQLNLYIYVRNNPLSSIDPFGLDCVYLDDAGGTNPNGQGGAEIDHNSDELQCHGTNGNWIPGTVANLDQVSTDPSSNWLNGRNTSGETWADCQGSGDCSTSAFGAFEGIATKITVNGDTPPGLSPSAQQTLGDVEQRTYGFNKAITCVSSVVMPFIPAPDPDDLSSLMLGTGKGGAEMAAGAAEGAANKISRASRQGPSRLARIAKLEHDAKLAGKIAKTVDAAGTALAVPEAYQNFKENCK